MKSARAVIALSAILIAVSACGSDAQTTRDSTAADKPAVVASTDVWGSVARAVAGDHAAVNSLLTSATADPHSFEASPSDAVAIIDASLVVYNGGGYDQWVDDVLRSHPEVASVDAYSLLDATALGESKPANEHVFYDLDTATSVAAEIADQLAKADPPNASDYRSNAEEFARQANTIKETETSIRTAHSGAAIVATEPVAHYLVLAAGLKDMTPPGFTAAIEQDTDPAPADLAAMLDVIDSRQIAAVLVNQQTATTVTERIEAAARSAGIPVVDVTETLPAGSDYLTWQRDTADRLAAALRQS